MGSAVPDVGGSSRAVILSGRSLFRFSGDIANSADDMPLLPEVLRKVVIQRLRRENGRMGGIGSRRLSHTVTKFLLVPAEDLTS